MDAAAVGTLLQQGLQTTFFISAPLLGIGLIIGVLVSVLQAATQINEVTLVFIPKMLGVGTVMWLLGPWMFERISFLMHEVAIRVASVSGGGM
ncbi:MAG: flagellar biosynthetic protein FliQ [Myxococcota bacterium]|nr:flagellar biosynthetic protein FliQ [Myxococcota bacterium]